MAKLPEILSKWEYRKEWEDEMTLERLNELGAEGWELVIIQKNVMTFKRPKLEESTTNDHN